MRRFLLVAAVAASIALMPVTPARAAGVVYGGAISYPTVMRRAASWLTAKVPYSQDNTRARWDVNRGRRYRTDCSGFVSMAWALDPAIPGLGRAPVTWELPAYAKRITWKSLRAGDILLLVDPADRGTDHVRLFERWADAGRAQAWTLEESYSYGGARRLLVTTATTAAGGYLPYRYRRIR
jgi:hypothetical protein